MRPIFISLNGFPEIVSKVTNVFVYKIFHYTDIKLRRYVSEAKNKISFLLQTKKIQNLKYVDVKSKNGYRAIYVETMSICDIREKCCRSECSGVRRMHRFYINKISK